MARNRTRIVSRFHAVKEAGYETVQLARKLALDAGEETAKRRIESGPYNLHPEHVHQENIGHQSGRVYYDDWWARFLEYGTTYIMPSPFMRPASRQMRKIFLGTMGAEFQGFINRRARVR